MLQGLVLRRAFFFIQIILGALVLVTAGILVLTVVAGERPSEGLRLAVEEPGVAKGSIASVGPRGAYDSIVTSGLFGDAARKYVEPEKPVAPPEEPLDDADTELPLTLHGTVVSGPDDPLATAIIEVREGPATFKTYYEGQEILTDVILTQILRKEVILENGRTNRSEHLRMLEGAERYKVAGGRSPSSRRSSRPSRQSAPQVVSIDRTEIRRELVDNYAEIANAIDVREYKDKDGKVKGLMATNLSSQPMAKKLGLMEGDILTSVNNEKIDSVDKVYQVIEKHRNAGTFRIGIIRDGKTKYIVYRLK